MENFVYLCLRKKTKTYPSMKQLLFSLFLCMSGMSMSGQDYVRYIDQRIGTGGNGHVFLGANAPWGLVQVGPTQYTRGWDWTSGYHDSDSILIGFGHMHLSGTGIGCLGDIALIPIKEGESLAGPHEMKFSHDDEEVRPGYYSIRLKDPAVRVELTATQRVAMHRYTPWRAEEGEKRVLAIDLAQCIGWDKMTECFIVQDSPTMLSGYRRSTGWAADRWTYFAIEFSVPVKFGEQSGDTLYTVQTANTEKTLLVKVALSPTSAGDAKVNMLTEMPGWDFDEVQQAAYEAWNKELSRIRIEAGEEQKKVFYTAMYHLMTAPSVFCNTDKSYRGADGKNHQADYTTHTTLSLWDTYRAAHPLMTLICPEKQRDFAETFMAICDEQGRLPVWHLMGNETDCMVGNPGAIVLADLVLKGFVEDKERAYKALRQTQMHDGRLLGTLQQYGYIPYDKADEGETVAKALEYCIADDAVARVAKMLGHKEDYRYFHIRSQSYKKYFDPQTGFMRAIDSNGKFREPFDPIKSRHRDDDYTEGNAWQYTWLVPHDVEGLVRLFGGKSNFIKKFDQFFTTEGDMGEFASPDISGLIGQYAHGNEPSHHMIYIYCMLKNEERKAAPLLRKVMDEMYHTGRDGLIGNEDVGQMSAWYILSAMGIYQVEPAGGQFYIGSPVVNKAEINVGNGKTFTVVAENNSRENILVREIFLNGKRLSRNWLTFSEIAQGGQLRLVMGR